MQSDASKAIGGDGDNSSTVGRQPTWQDPLIAHFASYWHNAILSMDSRSPLEEMRRHMDSDLDALATLSESFRSQRNRLCLPNRLPPEILSRIFVLISATPIQLPFGPDSLETELFTVSDTPSLEHPFPSTLICRYWRDVALYTPSVWATITPQFNLKWCKEMLSRAQSARMLVARILDPDDVLDLSAYVPRLQHLALRSSSIDAMRQVIAQSIKAPAISSKSLLFVYDEPDDDSDTFYDTPHSDYILPADFFGSDCPVLERVSLRGMMLPWTSSLWGGRITHLEILQERHLTALRPALRPTIEQFLQCLERMPALELLKLDICLPPATRDPQPLDNLPTIDLPYLRVLSINDSFSSCTYVLDHLRLPSLAELNISLHSDQRSIHYELTTSALARHIRYLLADQSISKVHISENLNWVKTEVWCQSGLDTSTNNGLQLGGPLPVFELSVSSNHMDDRAIQRLGRLFRCGFPLHDLEELSIGFGYHSFYDHPVTQNELRSAWLDILGQCSRILRLSLTIRGNNTSLPIMLGALTMDIDQRGYAQATAGASLPLPNLQELIIDAGDFYDAETAMSLKELIDLLVSQLSIRRKLGARICTLHVEVPLQDNHHPSLESLRDLSSDGTVSTVELGPIAAAWHLHGYGGPGSDEYSGEDL